MTMDNNDMHQYYETLKVSTPEQLKQRWSEISQNDYYYFLECVPPVCMNDNAFMVGECITHGVAGPIYDTCVKIDERYFMRPAYLTQFNPAILSAEIRSQYTL
jgi:hypothetical protein